MAEKGFCEMSANDEFSSLACGLVKFTKLVDVHDLVSYKPHKIYANW